MFLLDFSFPHRFGFPTNQESFLRPPHQMPGGPVIDNVPQQMRRSLSVDLGRPMGCNPQMGLPQHFPPRGLPMQQHNIMGQPFIELRHRAPENRVRLPFMPPNIMDHPNNSQRSSTSLVGGQNLAFPGTHGLQSFTPMMGQPQQVDHLQMSGSMENLHQQANIPENTDPQRPPMSTMITHSVSGEPLNCTQPTLLAGAVPGPTEEIPLPCGDGIEKLDADDSAVKDLEDVVVKDLVDDDLENLNLDADDGKDIDLETNDLHLDDFIESGKFDLLAYADPELNLEDKKDMFNEELDLSDPIEDDHGETEKSPQLPNKLEDSEPPSRGNQEENLEVGVAGSLLTTRTIKTEVKQDLVISEDHSVCDSRPLDTKNSQVEMSSLFEGSSQQIGLSSTGVPSSSAPVLSRLLTKEKLDDQGMGPVAPSHQGNLAQANQGPELQPNMGMMLQGQSKEHDLNTAMTVAHRMDPHAVAHGAPLGNPNALPVGSQQLPVSGFGASPGQQVDMNPSILGSQQPVPHNLHAQDQQVMYPPGSIGQQGQKLQQSQSNRPLLLDEQPLLLQDLLDQERQEQQQQRQMQAMIRQRSNDPFFPNIGTVFLLLLSCRMFHACLGFVLIKMLPCVFMLIVKFTFSKTD